MNVLAGVLLGASLVAALAARSATPSGVIVFASTRDGATGIYSIRPDGTHLTRLLKDGDSPRVSPDGKHIVFSTTDYDTTVLDTRTGVKRSLHRVGLGWTFERNPWSSDGTRFVVGGDDGVRVYTAEGTLERVVPASDAGEPTWSPDGTSIAYSGFDSGISIVRADGTGETRRLVANGDNPLWSPDGREVAFERFADSGPFIYVVPVSGGRPRRIGAGGSAAWSPDSSTLAVGGQRLRLYARSGTLKRTLLSGAVSEDPTWSPDGKTVVATVDGDLWLFARDGTSRRRLTEGRRNGYKDFDPSWATGAPAAAGVPVSGTQTYRGPLLAVSRTRGALLAGFPRVTGRAPQRSSDGPTVSAVASDGRGGWYLGGDFGFIGGVACPNLGHLDSALRVDRRWCQRPNGPVRALLRVGQTLYVGGEMSRVGEARRAGLAAFSIPRGNLMRWAPPVEGRVLELASDPAHRRIYLGGEFGHVDRAVRLDLAAVDAATGALTAFAPNPSRTFHGDGLMTFAVTATRVYASGFFPRIGGKVARAGLAALDPETGKVVAWKPACRCTAWSLAAAGDRVFAAGIGTRFGGGRRDDLAAFAGATGALDSWAPRTNGFSAFLVAPETSQTFVALGKFGLYGAQRLAAYGSSTASRVWLSPLKLDGAISSVAADARIVVVGGTFRNVR